jgi:hypothetical protein
MFQIVYRSMWTVVGNERDAFFISIMKFIMKGNKHRVTYAQFEENTMEKSGNWEFSRNTSTKLIYAHVGWNLIIKKVKRIPLMHRHQKLLFWIELETAGSEDWTIRQKSNVFMHKCLRNWIQRSTYSNMCLDLNIVLWF